MLINRLLPLTSRRLQIDVFWRHRTTLSSVCNYCKQRYIEYEGVDYPPSLDQLYGRSESRWRMILNRLYLELETLAPFLCFGVPYRGWPRFIIWCVVYCTVPYHWYCFPQWVTATNKCKIHEFFITSTSHLFSLSFWIVTRHELLSLQSF
jgi:hypothetical protein